VFSPVIESYLFLPIKTTTAMDAGIEQMMCVVGTKQREERQGEKGGGQGSEKIKPPSPFNFLWQGHYNQCNLDRKQLNMYKNFQ
jgi:hypothetical protein